jgi:hypothetical protein
MNTINKLRVLAAALRLDLCSRAKWSHLTGRGYEGMDATKGAEDRACVL